MVQSMTGRSVTMAGARMHDDEVETGPLNEDVLPTLTIHVAGTEYTVKPDDGPITIGRKLPAQIRVDDSRISRTHVGIELRDGHWTLTDVGSRNGTFVDGHRIESATVKGALTVHLGNPDGIAATLHTTEGGAADGAGVETIADGDADVDENSDEETATDNGELTDPGVARAGAAVAERREELGLSQRNLNDDHILSQSVLVKFERGRHWPRERTRAKIEEYLRWPQGSIAQIRAGADIPDDESTEVLSASVQVAVLVDATGIALTGIHARIGMLPAGTDPAFAAQAALLLGELRRLQSTLANAVRTSSRNPQIALLLSRVRRSYADLMLEVADAPGARPGQRLYAARHRAALTAEEVANAAGISVDDINNAESGLGVSGPALAAIEDIIATLSTT
jgi:pSer/pThr/pTyr-binding forkhead associated (FHA) protein/transcriptional regulator with XRE-family HTH domain